MNRRQQWVTAWLIMILTWVLVLPSSQTSVTALAEGRPLVQLDLSGRGFDLRAESLRASSMFEIGTGISLQELRAEDQKLLEQKRLGRRAEELSIPRNLLTSRSIHLAQAAKQVQEQSRLRVAREAERFIGTPYVWGGTTPQGFDCSGFTQYVYRVNGVEVPRNSYDQFAVGESVPKQELQPGDLVFFSTYAPGPSHLGIYVGEGKFVHALNDKTGVITSTLEEQYYHSRFIGAKRVI